MRCFSAFTTFVILRLFFFLLIIIFINDGGLLGNKSSIFSDISNLFKSLNRTNLILLRFASHDFLPYLIGTIKSFF